MKAICTCGATAELTPEEQRQIHSGGLACPYCGGSMRLAASRAERSAAQTKECPVCAESIPATAVRCRYCGEDLLTADGWGDAAGPPRRRSRNRAGRAGNSALGPIEICLLVSAIGNVVLGMLYAATLIGIVLTVPMVVLCVFEFSLHGKVRRLPEVELAERVKPIAIFEIIVGLFNLVSLVCGIINLVHANRLQEEADW